MITYAETVINDENLLLYIQLLGMMESYNNKA